MTSLTSPRLRSPGYLSMAGGAEQIQLPAAYCDCCFKQACWSKQQNSNCSDNMIVITLSVLHAVMESATVCF